MSNQKLLPKIARLASESIDTPALAYVWSRGNANLLLIGEINLPYATAQGVIANIISFIDEVWASSNSHLDTAEETLENILVSLNQLLARVFSPYPFNPSSPRYHLAIAFFRYPEISLSTIGSAGVFIVSPTRFSNVIKNSQMAEGEIAPPPPKKPLFTQIVTGKIKTGESLLLTNPAILDYFSIEQLKQIINNYVPGQASMMISNLLKQLDRKPPVSLIILKLQSLTQGSESAASVQGLIEKQSITDDILSPSFFSSLTKRAKSMMAAWTKKKDVAIPSVLPQKNSINRQQINWQKGVKFIKNIRIPWRRSDIKLQLTKLLEQIISNYRHLSQSYRIIFNIVIVLIFILSFSIVNSGKDKLTLVANAEFQQLSSEINQKIGEIEATAIYQDEQKLGTLIAEAQDLLKLLPQKSSEQQQQYQNLQTKINTLAERSLKQVTINNPEIIADLSSLGAHNWRGLIVDGSATLAFAEDGSIATIETGAVKIINTLPPEARPLAQGYKVNDNLVLFSSTGNVNTIYDFKKNSFNIIKNTVPEFIDAAAYEGSRLYALASNPRYIFRINVSDNSISGLTRWLKVPENIPAASALTVDGSIFVLNNSIIEEYVRGSKREFSYVINPTLKNPSKILTENIDGPLYILDKDTNRVVILTKEGVLTQQLLFPSLSPIIDLDVNNATLLLFDGTRVVRAGVIN